MTTAAYYRAWRAAHPAYRDRQCLLRAEHRRLHPRDRTGEYARRASRALPAVAPLTPLFPDLQRGTRLSFWEDELRMDVRQERSLAELEGRDPAVAEASLRARETSWWHHIAPLYEYGIAA